MLHIQLNLFQKVFKKPLKPLKAKQNIFCFIVGEIKENNFFLFNNCLSKFNLNELKTYYPECFSKECFDVLNIGHCFPQGICSFRSLEHAVSEAKIFIPDKKAAIAICFIPKNSLYYSDGKEIASNAVYFTGNILKEKEVINYLNSEDPSFVN